MSNWFKFQALHENEKWMEEELANGRLRYGWSPPGSNLLELDKYTWEELDKMILKGDGWEAPASYIYRQGQFLIHRICGGDKIVVQLGTPLTKFYIFEVSEGYIYPETESPDFNHILKGKLITPIPIPIYSKYVSNDLRHDLSKRGKYYQIYSDSSCEELNSIVESRLWLKDDIGDEATQESELQKMDDELIAQTIKIIQKRWKSKYFEGFTINLLQKIDGIDVKDGWDAGLGWDLTISIRDKLTGEVLHDDVPVQCKNYYGEVVTEKPIEDLERCIRNSPPSVDIAYLFILGDLTEQFYKALETLELKMKTELQRNISFRVVDQSQVAKLYLGV